MNRALLGIGFVVMVLGSAVLIYMTIKDQGEEKMLELQQDKEDKENTENKDNKDNTENKDNKGNKKTGTSKTTVVAGEAFVIKTSDAVKKIILNFLQMLSLASGLPMQWPPEIDVMFQSMATVSSAGSTLLIPDCEMSDMKTAE